MASIELKLQPLATPNYVNLETPPRPRQEGFQKTPSIPVSELSVEALDGLVSEWITDLYDKAGKSSHWVNHPTTQPTGE